MIYPSLARYIADSPDPAGQGAVAILFVEDGAEVAATISHHLRQGFVEVLLIGRLAVDAAVPEGAAVARIEEPIRSRSDAIGMLNQLVDRYAG